MLDNPDQSLKDLAVSGYTGGSSSVLARKDSSDIYIPLKKRVMEKSMSSSKLTLGSSFLDQTTYSLIESKQ